MMCPLLLTPDVRDGFDAAFRAGSQSCADALLLDLGAAAAPADRAARRAWAAEVLARHPRRGAGPAGRGGAPAIVRLSALATGLVDADLDAVMAGAPEAVLVPGVVGGRDLQHVAAKLAVREAEHGLAAGRTRIVAAPADTAAGVLALQALPGATARLLAVAWDAGALATALRAGRDASPVRAARGLLLIAAAAAGVPAIDGCGAPDPSATEPPAGDELARDCDAARRDGFAGRLARSIPEVEVIRSRFAPVRRGSIHGLAACTPPAG